MIAALSLNKNESCRVAAVRLLIKTLVVLVKTLVCHWCDIGISRGFSGTIQTADMCGI